MRGVHTFRLFTVFALLVGSLAAIGAPGYSRHLDRSVPVDFSVDPPRPQQNQQVFVTVTLNSPPSSDQEVAIGSTNLAAFADLPSVVTVSAGTTSVTFSTTTTSSFTATTALVATCNSKTIIWIQPLQGGG